VVVAGGQSISVDFYVAVPAAQWPTAAAVEQCPNGEGYPIKVRRFPAIDAKKVVTDGAIVSVNGGDAYLEGELSPSGSPGEEVRSVNERIGASGGAFRITDRQALISFRERSPSEMRLQAMSSLAWWCASAATGLSHRATPMAVRTSRSHSQKALPCSRSRDTDEMSAFHPLQTFRSCCCRWGIRGLAGLQQLA
jgi:hypothetical protein